MNVKSVALLAITLGAIAGTMDAWAQAQTLRVEPGAVRHDPTDGVSGSFRLVRDSGGTWSTGRGGACLLADFSASLGASPCVTHGDCDATLAAFLDALPNEASADGTRAYCARPEGAREPKGCWLRPGPQAQYCVVSPLTPLLMNQPVRLPAPPAAGVPAFPLQDGEKVRWMVYTCLNGFDFSQPAAARDRPGCANGDPGTSTSLGGRPKTLKPAQP